jgi:hypothetical protein
VVGSLFLVVYFSAPLNLPPDNATVGQIARFAVANHDRIMLAAWLQSMGSLLGVVFFLALIHATGGVARLASWVAMVGLAVLLTLSVIESLFFIDVAEATSNNHPLTALSSYDMQTIFVHGFLTVAAPMVYVAVGVLLLKSTVLPRGFAYLALALGATFEILGFAALFSDTADTIAVAPLILEAIWILSASVMILRTRNDPMGDVR